MLFVWSQVGVYDLMLSSSLRSQGCPFVTLIGASIAYGRHSSISLASLCLHSRKFASRLEHTSAMYSPPLILNEHDLVQQRFRSAIR